MTGEREVRTIALLALAAPAMVAGCLDEGRAGFSVVNGTGGPLDVLYERGPDTRVSIIDDLAPGGSYEINRFVGGGECDDATMVATDESGAVVARFPGPVCDGTEWVVEVAGSSASPSA